MNLLINFRFRETNLSSGLGIIFPVIFTNGSQTRPSPGRIIPPATTFLYIMYINIKITQ